MDLPVCAPATSMAALPLVRLCSSSPMYTISSAGLNMLNLAPFANTCPQQGRPQMGIARTVPSGPTLCSKLHPMLALT